MLAVFSLPGLSSSTFQLVDPGFVDLNRVCVEAQALVLNDVFNDWSQQLSEGVVTTCTSVEAHHHLDNCWIACHYVLDLVHLRTETRREDSKGLYRYSFTVSSRL